MNWFPGNQSSATKEIKSTPPVVLPSNVVDPGEVLVGFVESNSKSPVKRVPSSSSSRSSHVSPSSSIDLSNPKAVAESLQPPRIQVASAIEHPTLLAGGHVDAVHSISVPALAKRIASSSAKTTGGGVVVAHPASAVAMQSTYPTVFHWSGSGANVYLTGDFNQWNGKVPMHRSNNDFTLILDMPPGKYHYKFIVDGDWRHSNEQPTVTDEHGVLNNIVEVDPQQIFEFDIREREESNNDLVAHENHVVVDVKDPTSHSAQQAYLATQTPGELEYSCDLPLYLIQQQHIIRQTSQSSSPTLPTPSLPPNQLEIAAADYLKDPPILPPMLYDVFLNGSCKYADPYVLPVPQNVTLQHMFNATPLVRSEELVVLGITRRYQSKFITTIVYKPNLKRLAQLAAANAVALAQASPPTQSPIRSPPANVTHGRHSGSISGQTVFGITPVARNGAVPGVTAPVYLPMSTLAVPISLAKAEYQHHTHGR